MYLQNDRRESQSSVVNNFANGPCNRVSQTHCVLKYRKGRRRGEWLDTKAIDRQIADYEASTVLFLQSKQDALRASCTAHGPLSVLIKIKAIIRPTGINWLTIVTGLYVISNFRAIEDLLFI